MKKGIAVVLSLLLAVCLLAGCVGQPAASVPTGSSEPSNLSSPPEGSTGTGEPEGGWVFPSIDESYFDLLCEDVDVTYHIGGDIADYIMLFFVSAYPLDKEEEFQISTDQSVSAFKANDIGGDRFRCGREVVLSYQAFDWATYAKLCTEDSDAAIEMEQKYTGALEQADDAIPALYLYKVNISIPDLFSKYRSVDGESREWKLPEGTDTVSVEELTVTYRGESKTYHPRNLSLTTKQVETGYDVFLSCSIGPCVDPSVTGEFSNMEGFPLKCRFDGDVTLTGVAFPEHPESQLVAARLKITPPDGRGFEMEWDGKTPVEVDAGSEVALTLNWTKPDLAGKLAGGALQYFSLLYEQDGEACAATGDVMYLVRPDAFAFYAQKYDGVDMTPYYRDFYPVWKELLENEA